MAFMGKLVVFLLFVGISCGFVVVDDKIHTGYVTVNETNGNTLFYYYAEARDVPSATAPVVLWETGGPGCSSMTASFCENGPSMMQPSGEVKTNDYAWNKKANVLYFDQPAGTGFSYVGESKEYATTEYEVSKELYVGLQKFFANFPGLIDNDFYVFGESYAGKYIPNLATYILDKNNEQGANKIQLKGVGIGDGWISPPIQLKSYISFAAGMGVLASHEIEKCDIMFDEFMLAYEAGKFDVAHNISDSLLDTVLTLAGQLDQYDVRYYGNNDPIFPLIDKLGKYFQRPEVIKDLNVHTPWQFASGAVEMALYEDILKDSSHLLPRLTEEIRVLIYNGQFDLVCNHLGTNEFLNRLEDWKHREEYVRAPQSTWHVNGQVAGFSKVAGQLTRLVVLGAGHQVPFNQPQNSLEMLDRFMNNKPFDY